EEWGKGGGCVPSSSKKRASLVNDNPDPNPIVNASENVNVNDIRDNNVSEKTIEADPVVLQQGQHPPTFEDASSSPISAPAKLRIFIVYYSMYGHVEALAKKMKEGVDVIEGVEGVLFRVPEMLSAEVLEQMRAPPKDESIPIITAAELPAADGIVFGFPTRYGAMAAQMKAFFDSTGKLWTDQKLAGKPAGFFVSTGTQGGGQETTA
ncbi:hypothetical protein KI387_003238, partial [Taxus chinensis]